ncbi:Cell death protease [Exophiala xenobiotica]|nr:Cell death protease [Exophiala xenobiotica]KAK5287875.1 Cell death protease [Exophiala xenobiotica]KAK5380629.1 Cell death protease [Exophiala xenobiotica]KAK5392876.1 Cell death protease [Exophiala xenobiotica]KAK5411931.1 Cell death protease [Exophiala xenobiotica]
MAGFSSCSQRSPAGWLARLTHWTLAVLLFTALPAKGDKTAADYYVHSLPGQPDGPLLKMHAGHIEITPEHNGHLFFWHYQNRHIADRRRTVIWLNGGPGCSSMDGAMMELGPYRVREGGKLAYNEGSWDEFANLLFVDNPVGTGFSYVNTDSYLHELQEMADQFLIFMEKWFVLFPQYENDDIYFAGESYAGQHIPYIARAILDRNIKSSADGKQIWNVKGLLIGNGWIAPKEQYLSYLPFAYQEGLIQGGTEEAARVESAQTKCLGELGKPGGAEKVDVNICETVLSMVLDVTKKDGKCFNMYDIRLQDHWPSCGMAWPPDLTTVTPYLRQQNVIDALHINPDKRTGWTECSGSVSSAFRASHSKPSVDFLPGIMEAGVPILLFSGAKDMICNHLGTEDMISNLKWSGGTGFELSPGIWAPKREWTFEGEIAGLYQEARNLTYVLFYNASHMVPFDWPRRSRDMLDRFMGVDIASIGGTPADSRLDGEKAGSETSVGGHPNSTLAIEDEQNKLKEAELKAYYRSGEAALVIVLIAAGLFGWWVWRSRRARSRGYVSVPLANGLTGKGRDVEAGDFDENELDTFRSGRPHTDMETEPYDLGSDSEDEHTGSHSVGRVEGREKGSG